MSEKVSVVLFPSAHVKRSCFFVCFCAGGLDEDEHPAGLWGRHGRVLLQPELDRGRDPTRVQDGGDIPRHRPGGEHAGLRQHHPLPARHLYVTLLKRCSIRSRVLPLSNLSDSYFLCVYLLFDVY